MKAMTWTKVRAALASLVATALLAVPVARAHDEPYDHDDSDDYDEYGYDYGYDDDYEGDEYYEDEYYDDDTGYHTDACDPYGCAHASPIPRYDDLGQYGEWRWVPSFRAHLWFPWVEASWRPYTYGHWIRTSFGMTWVSYEPWGEIPHHYGQWVFLEPYGWAWVPGYEYSPAWVTWGVVDGYVGWAPCPPIGYRYPHYHSYSASVHFLSYGYPGSYAYHDSGLDFSFWIFVSNRDFCERDVYRRAIAPHVTLSLFKSKRVLPAGPRLDVNYVERVSPKRVRMVDVDRRTKRIGDRAIDVYEPRGQKDLVRAGRENTKRNWAKLSSTRFEEKVQSRRQALVARSGDDNVRLSRSADDRVRGPRDSRSTEDRVRGARGSRAVEDRARADEIRRSRSSEERAREGVRRGARGERPQTRRDERAAVESSRREVEGRREARKPSEVRERAQESRRQSEARERAQESRRQSEARERAQESRRQSEARERAQESRRQSEARERAQESRRQSEARERAQESRRPAVQERREAPRQAPQAREERRESREEKRAVEPKGRGNAERSAEPRSKSRGK